MSSDMNYKIIDLEEQKFLGKSCGRVNTETDFSIFWMKFYEKNKNYDGITYGVSSDFMDDEFTYMICVPLTEEDRVKDFQPIVVDAATYVIFGLVGPVNETIPSAWGFAMKNFDLAESPNLEVYSDGNRMDVNYKMELWIPIKK